MSNSACEWDLDAYRYWGRFSAMDQMGWDIEKLTTTEPGKRLLFAANASNQ